ncbi:hypothetical protein MYX82_06370 [Acidobacteria bacterium AH-259-D05]|nr:hypothetical protein [Acidobacteria bacterium AH-259-D05]
MIISNNRFGYLLLCFVILACGVVAFQSSSVVQGQDGEREEKLTSEVSDFLTMWLVEQDPEGTVKKHLSEQLMDESLIPAGWYSTRDYMQRFPDNYHGQAFPISNEIVVERTGEYLKKLLEEFQGVAVTTPTELSDVLAPFNSDTDPELWEILKERELTPVSHFGGLPIHTVNSGHWEDFSWIAPATLGYQWRLPGMVDELDSDMRGVLLRLRPPGEENSSLMCMFWADESSAKVGTWKCWGISPVLTE